MCSTCFSFTEEKSKKCVLYMVLDFTFQRLRIVYTRIVSTRVWRIPNPLCNICVYIGV